MSNFRKEIIENGNVKFTVKGITEYRRGGEDNEYGDFPKIFRVNESGDSIFEDSGLFGRGMNITKLEHEHDNIENGWDFTDEDLQVINSKLETAFTDLEWFVEAVELGLFAIKHAAYRLGRTRSVTAPEP